MVRLMRVNFTEDHMWTAIFGLMLLLPMLHYLLPADPCKKLESCGDDQQCYETFKDLCQEQIRSKEGK